MDTLNLTLLCAAGLLFCGFLAVFAHKYFSRLKWRCSWNFQIAHMIQPLAQSAVLLYMGFCSPIVARIAPLIFYQLAFAIAFDIFLGLALKREARFGFAVFPIVGSINLFIWFYPEYFYLQLLVVAFAVASKYLFVWRDEKRTHIFNPSALALTCACLAIVFFGGRRFLMLREIISVYQAATPSIFMVIFLAGSVSTFVGRTTLVTLSSGLILYAVFHFTQTAFGLPLMNVWITPSILIGTTLLVTDPKTCPRTPLAQLLFGAAYGLLIISSYGFLSYMREPGYFEKILPVPALNLMVPWLERIRIRKPAIISPWLAGAAYGLIFLALFPYTKGPEHQLSILGKLGGEHWARANSR